MSEEYTQFLHRDIRSAQDTIDSQRREIKGLHLQMEENRALYLRNTRYFLRRMKEMRGEIEELHDILGLQVEEEFGPDEENEG